MCDQTHPTSLYTLKGRQGREGGGLNKAIFNFSCPAFK